MKILQINAVYGAGSTGNIVKDLHELAMERGIDSYVAYSTSPIPNNEFKNGYVIGNKIEKLFHALFCRLGGRQAYFSKSSTRKLIKYIDKIKPDVVHLHNLHSNYVHLNLLLDYLAKSRISTVITLHDCWFYTGGCFHYASVGCDSWQNGGCKNCKKRKKALPLKVYNSQRTLKDREKYLRAIENLTVVGVSNWIAEEAKKGFLKDKRVITIHNGIDLDFFKDTPSDLREKYAIEDKFVILGPANKWLAEINKQTLKGFLQELDDKSVFVLFGCDKENFLDLPDNVIKIGYTRDREKLKKIYSMADVFVNCTREESLSLVNVEAQACGTPVITYRDTGVQETVDEKCGFTIATGDYKALVEKTLQIKAKSKNFYKEECRKFVEENFNKESNYAEYIKLYEQLNRERKGNETNGD